MSSKSWSSLCRHLGRPQADICLLVGSGIHAQWTAATHREERARKVLSSWLSLLKALGPETQLADTLPPMLWEQLTLADVPTRAVRNKFGITPNDWSTLAALKRESMLQKATAELIADAESVLTASARCGLDPVQRVVKSRVVTDVISLNLDTVTERILGNWKSPAQWIRTKQPQVVDGGAGEPIRLWHPHGDRRRPTSIKLGLRHYASLTPQIEKARKDAKRLERELGYPDAWEHARVSPKSWVELVLNRSILVLGASLSESEWDLWQSFVDRQRNFAKSKNRVHRPAAWILSTPCSHAKVPNGWFGHLQAADWNSAWNRLADMMPD